MNLPDWKCVPLRPWLRGHPRKQSAFLSSLPSSVLSAGDVLLAQQTRRWLMPQSKKVCRSACDISLLSTKSLLWPFLLIAVVVSVIDQAKTQVLIRCRQLNFHSLEVHQCVCVCVCVCVCRGVCACENPLPLLCSYLHWSGVGHRHRSVSHLWWGLRLQSVRELVPVTGRCVVWEVCSEGWRGTELALFPVGPPYCRQPCQTKSHDLTYCGLFAR